MVTPDIRISGRIIRPFFISDRIQDLTGRPAGRIPDTENSWISGRISGKIKETTIRDAPDNPAFFYIRYPAGYQIAQPDIRYSRIPDIRPDIRLM
jgi:hypothetical protein